MKISVVIITHNRYEYACAALESVFDQSCPASQAILVDDGSTFDFKRRYAAEYPERAAKIDFVRLGDLGPSSARNAGAEIATGDGLAFLDDDDQMDSEYLRSCVQIMESKNSDLIVTPMVNFDETGKTWDGKSLPSEFDLDEVMLKNMGVVGSNIFMKTDAFKEVGAFNSELKGSEDKDFLLRFIIHGKKISRNSQRLIRYRHHPETQVSGQNKFHKFQLQGKKRFYDLYKSKMKFKTRWALYSQVQYFILNGESSVLQKMSAFTILCFVCPKYIAKTILIKLRRA
ncbi:MAG: hypothetical protein COB76_05940 [Alphaproteobacteria bacterium]|nr:MAG: hypothetical protein COB76_05940 [Alphaproteobacteria bacterium]